MAYWGGLPRNPQGWAEIRGSIADFMVEKQADPAWIAIFSQCGEVMPAQPPGEPVPTLASGSAAALASGSAAQAPHPADLPPPLPPPAEPPAPLARPPGSQGPPVVSDNFAALLDGALGSSKLEQTFPAWLAGLDHDKLLAVMRDFSIRAAEDAWLKGRPKRSKPQPSRRGKRAESRFSYRLATGLRFKRWLASEEGRASKAPLRDTWS